jgi:hypothetical protein
MVSLPASLGFLQADSASPASSAGKTNKLSHAERDATSIQSNKDKG